MEGPVDHPPQLTPDDYDDGLERPHRLLDGTLATREEYAALTGGTVVYDDDGNAVDVVPRS